MRWHSCDGLLVSRLLCMLTLSLLLLLLWARQALLLPAVRLLDVLTWLVLLLLLGLACMPAASAVTASACTSSSTTSWQYITGRCFQRAGQLSIYG